jgi:hypothetical protein
MVLGFGQGLERDYCKIKLPGHITLVQGLENGSFASGRTVEGTTECKKEKLDGNYGACITISIGEDGVPQLVYVRRVRRARAGGRGVQ